MALKLCCCLGGMHQAVLTHNTGMRLRFCCQGMINNWFLFREVSSRLHRTWDTPVSTVGVANITYFAFAANRLSTVPRPCLRLVSRHGYRRSSSFRAHRNFCFESFGSFRICGPCGFHVSVGCGFLGLWAEGPGGSG
jgi:hypothetical protein